MRAKRLYVTGRAQWRAWLDRNHATETELWLIYYKKHTGRPRIAYEDAVEEALCFGWIDSIVKRIDDESYAQKFTPRRAGSKWSTINKRRVAKLLQEGRMTEAGLATIQGLELDRAETQPETGRSFRELAIPSDIEKAFRTSKKAWAYFGGLAPSYRRNYLLWITSAKRAETRQRRVKEALELLAQGKKLGLK